MRQIYSSVRLENVDRVVALMNEEGIETSVTGGRSFKRSGRRDFSFKEQNQDPATVWIVRSEDVARASEIMRSAGLLRSTRDADFVPSAGRFAPRTEKAGLSMAWRIRLGLLVVVVLLSGFAIAQAQSQGELTVFAAASLTDAYAFIKLGNAAGVSKDISIVVNMAPTVTEGEKTYKTLLKACENFLRLKPPMIGMVRQDKKVKESIRHQTPLLIRSPNTEAAEDVEKIAATLWGALSKAGKKAATA